MTGLQKIATCLGLASAAWLVAISIGFLIWKVVQ